MSESEDKIPEVEVGFVGSLDMVMEDEDNEAMQKIGNVCLREIWTSLKVGIQNDVPNDEITKQIHAAIAKVMTSAFALGALKSALDSNMRFQEIIKNRKPKT